MRDVSNPQIMFAVVKGVTDCILADGVTEKTSSTTIAGAQIGR